MQNGLMVWVYRNPGHDCTLGGLSSKHDTLTLVGEGVAEVFAPTPDMPALELRTRKVGSRVYVNAAPAGETRWTMFGGNFIHSSDSRFAALNNGYPIPVHDRVETHQNPTYGD